MKKAFVKFVAGIRVSILKHGEVIQVGSRVWLMEKCSSGKYEESVC